MRARSRTSVWLAGLVAVCLLTSTPALAGPPDPGKPGKPIALDSGPETDQAIEQRLEAVFAELDSLEGIEVEVESGVVHLGGQVHGLEAIQEAEAIAERVEGVVAVTTDIRQEVKISRRVEPVFDQMGERVIGWLSYLPLVVCAVVAIALAWILARTVARRIRKHNEPNTFARLIAEQAVRAGIIAIGLAIALEVLGARGLLGAMVGTAGVLGIVLGIAFKSVGETYIASLLLSMRRPFDPHDFVRIDEVDGTVVRLTSRATVLMTVDGNYVSVPNSTVFNATVINFTRNPQRRFVFKLGIGTDADLCHVQNLAVETLAAVPGVLSEPKPTCLIDAFGDSEIVVNIAGWVDQRQADWLKVSSEAKRQIKVAFDREGIDMPEPILRVRTTTFEPRKEAPERTPTSAADVAPDQHLERKVEQERQAHPEDDLMREGGKVE